MIKALTKTEKKCWHFVDGKRIDGVPSCLSGDVSGLRGDVSDLSGDVSGLSGDVDDCKITEGERKAGIKITDLIETSE